MYICGFGLQLNSTASVSKLTITHERPDRYFLACANRSKSGPAFSKSASVIAGVIYTSAFKSSHNGSNSPGILSSLGTFNTKYIVRCPCERYEQGPYSLKPAHLYEGEISHIKRKKCDKSVTKW